MAVVGLHGLGELGFQGVTHELEGERIHADDDEQEGPAAVLVHIDELMESGEIWMLRMRFEVKNGHGPCLGQRGAWVCRIRHCCRLFAFPARPFRHRRVGKGWGVKNAKERMDSGGG